MDAAEEEHAEAVLTDKAPREDPGAGPAELAEGDPGAGPAELAEEEEEVMRVWFSSCVLVRVSNGLKRRYRANARCVFA